MKLRLLTSIMGGMLVAASAWAIPFDNSSGGPATATVNAGGGADYTSLAGAVAAFDAVAGGINRPWTLEIQSNLTETADSYIANTFGPAGSLTIKPAAAAQPIIDFTNLTAPAGIYGHLVIGCTTGAVLPDSTNTFSSNNNYVIDGSNTVGGTTRDMTLRWVAGNSPTNRIIRIWANNHGMVIKNLTIDFQDTAGTNSCIGLAAGTATGITGRLAPNNTVIQNCLLKGLGAANSCFGVDSSPSANGVLPAGTAIEGTQILNNDIIAKQRGIFMNAFGSATIADNRITITSGTGAALSYQGIFHFTSNGAEGWTQNVYNNRIEMPGVPTTTAEQGAYGILMDSQPVVGTYNIYNNNIKNIIFATATAGDYIYRGITASSVNSNYMIEHNSLDLPANNVVTAATNHRVGGVVGVLQFTTGSLTVRNNIIRFGNTGTSATLISLASAAAVTCAGNNLVPAGTPNVGIVVPNAYTTLAAWQGAGFDSLASGGQSADPTGTTPAWDADLHFASKPIAGMGTVQTSTFLTDIDGNPRPASGAVPGSDEPQAHTGVSEWMMF
ncbi:MAG: hypothetical protein WCK47_06020 [bacterium]